MRKLSIRLAQVQDLLVGGLTVVQISAELGIAVGPVKTPIEKIYYKRGIKARRELAQIQIDEANLVIELTPNQAQVLKGFAAGKSLPQLATEMGISLRTVESYRRHLYQKNGRWHACPVYRCDGQASSRGLNGRRGRMFATR